MDDWEDYYLILQVHYLAEDEVIEGAYRKLSKKYHPDVNTEIGATAKMQQINNAYAVLSDPSLRKQYFLRWIEKHSGLNSTSKEKSQANKKIFSYDPTKGILIQYFQLISQQKFSLAYALLCKADQKNISKADFIKWQTQVAEVFELRSFDCTVKELYADITVQNTFYAYLVVFNVNVVEVNHVMERVEEDDFTKSIVFENNEWRLLLGYKDVSSMIKKYDELAQFKKSNLAEKKKSHRLQNTDSLSGLLNRRGFTENALKEQTRRNRYGNVFSIVLCELSIQCHSNEKLEQVIRQSGQLIKSCLRTLDISCRWKGTKFYILLPETPLELAQVVTVKIRKKIQRRFENEKEIFVTFHAVTLQQVGDSLHELLQDAEQQMKDSHTGKL